MSKWPNLLAHRSDYDMLMDMSVTSDAFFGELARRKHEPAPIIDLPIKTSIFRSYRNVRIGFVNAYRDGAFGACHETRSDCILWAMSPVYRIRIIPKARCA